MAELKIASLILFVGVMVFIVCIIGQLIQGVDEYIPYESRFPEGKGALWKTDFTDSFFWSTVSTAFVAYSFQAAFFPIMRDLKEPTNANGL